MLIVGSVIFFQETCLSLRLTKSYFAAHDLKTVCSTKYCLSKTKNFVSKTEEKKRERKVEVEN
jgi:hypothetical protein